MAGNNTLIYRKQGGASLVINGASGAMLLPGTETQPSHVSALKVDYTTGNLDTEAEIIAAINATNTRINLIMSALEGIGVFAAS